MHPGHSPGLVTAAPCPCPLMQGEREVCSVDWPLERARTAEGRERFLEKDRASGWQLNKILTSSGTSGKGRRMPKETVLRTCTWKRIRQANCLRLWQMCGQLLSRLPRFWKPGSLSDFYAHSFH